jgi:hypothetical protein
MAHFAKLNNNIVERVEVVNNTVITDSNGIEQEQLGIDFLKTLYNEPNAIWKQTSYNLTFRKNYGNIGYFYDQTKDVFIAPKPFNSWVLNQDTCQWEAPISKPENPGIISENERQYYDWNETQGNWELITITR